MSRSLLAAALLLTGLGAADAVRAQGFAGPGATIPEPLPCGPMAPGQLAPGPGQPGAPRPPGSDEPNAVEGHNGTGGFNSFGEEECGDKAPCPQGPDFGVGFEYLQWRTKRALYPLLATTGSTTDTIPGAIGQPNTIAIMGGRDGGLGPRPGFRLNGEWWLDNQQVFSVTGSFFVLEQTTKIQRASSDATGEPVIARPFFDAAAGMENADPVSLPGLLSGSIVGELSSRLMGGELNLSLGTPISMIQPARFSLFAGPRWLYLDEKLQAFENVSELPAGIDTTTFIHDDFSTQNRFYGVQLGSKLELGYGPVNLDVVGKIAGGMSNETLHINGTTIINEQGSAPIVSLNEGLLAQPTNVGRYTRNQFAFVPEIDTNLGWQINDKIRIFVGYSYFYWSDVFRPGNQVDRVVNIQPLNAPVIFPPFRPLPPLISTNFFAEGINLGVQFTF